MIKIVKKLVPYETWIIENIGFLCLLGIILSIPFSIRNVFNTSLNFKTGAYSDFTSISLYLSDFLVIFLVFSYFNRIKSSTWNRIIGLSILWLALELIIHRFYPLETYFSARIVALLLFCAILQNLPLNKAKIEVFTWFFVILGSIQTIIGLIQFIGQKSVGLYILGESHISPGIYGVAKIVAHGTKYIRSYGTFPHPNLLSGFLVTSTLLCVYLLTLTYQKYTKILLSILFSINIIGVLLTFSRGGVLALIIGLLIMGFSLLVTKQRKTLIHIALLAIIVGGLSGLILKPYLLTRTTVTDESSKERLFYDKIGLKMIKDHFIVAEGPGLSVLHMEQYSPTKLETWEIQPIHNYYLITFTEWGIGGLLLMALILTPIIQLIKKTRVSLYQRIYPSFFWEATLLAIAVCFLFLFFIDHYFYTIWQTQLLLWMMIGLITAQTKKQTV